MWSYLLAVVGVAGIFLAGRKTSPWIGWALGLSAQALWVLYALASRQYGFLLSAAAYGTVYALNVARARRGRPGQPAAAGDVPVLPEPGRGSVLVHGRRYVVRAVSFHVRGGPDEVSTVAVELADREQLAAYHGRLLGEPGGGA